VLGLSRVGSVFSLSVMEIANLGSSMSLRSFTRLGSSMSVFDFLHLGSSLSLRCFTRLGSSVSLLGMARVGSALSLVDCANFGSSLSVRSFARFGSGIQFTSSNTYITDTGSGLELYVSGSRAATFDSTGGTLHGTWDADNALSMSDRRLKKDIMPLQRTLRDALSSAISEGASDQAGGAVDAAGAQQLGGAKAAPQKPGASAADSTLWLLRQLRPVSYSFKKGAESKYMRFGFIADELESVVPQVVRNVGNRNRADYEDQKAVVYQDLIALLVAASQSQTQKLDEQSAQIEGQTQKLDDQTQKLDEQSTKIEELSKDYAELQDAQAAQSKQMSKQMSEQAQQSKQMAELFAELRRMKQARRSQEEEGAHLVTGVANATELANETDQNDTSIENATGGLNFTNSTSANISNKTTQTRLRKP